MDNESNMEVGGTISMAQRPIFFGNLRHDCMAKDIEDMFERPIIPIAETGIDETQPVPIDRVDLKRGFAFVFLKDAVSEAEKNRVERFVSEINGMNVKNVSNALRSEFARGDGRVKRKEDIRRKDITPSETLFVVNFHEETTKREDLEMLFQPYGELIRVDMKRNYAFVQFSTVEEASRAKEATNGGKLDQSVITVEYVARRMGEGRRRRDSPPRDRYRDDRYDRRDRFDDRGPRRDDGYRGRDRSPYRRERSRSRDRFRGRSRSPPRRTYDDDRRRRSPDRRYDDRGRYDDGPRYGGLRDGDRRSPDREGFAGRDYDRRGRGGRSRSRERSPPRGGYGAGRGRSPSPPPGGRGGGVRDFGDRDERRGSERGAGTENGGAAPPPAAREFADRERGYGGRDPDRGYGSGGPPPRD